MGQESGGDRAVQALQYSGFVAKHRRDRRALIARDLQRDWRAVKVLAPIDLSVVQRSDHRVDFEFAKRLARSEIRFRHQRVNRIRRDEDAPLDQPGDGVERHVEDRERVLLVRAAVLHDRIGDQAGLAEFGDKRRQRGGDELRRYACARTSDDRLAVLNRPDPRAQPSRKFGHLQAFRVRRQHEPCRGQVRAHSNHGVFGRAKASSTSVHEQGSTPATRMSSSAALTRSSTSIADGCGKQPCQLFSHPGSPAHQRLSRWRIDAGRRGVDRRPPPR